MSVRARAVGATAFVALLAAGSDARAVCAGRPSDAGGFNGYVYPPAVEKTHDSARVRVHYTTTGTHAPDQTTTRGDGVPDVIAHTADSAEAALSKYQEMGFKLPPSDTACTSNGGDDKIDVYIVAFKGADGSTIAESCTSTQCSSFVLVASGFVGTGYPSVKEGFRTVVAHELFHAVQNTYSPAQEDRTWAEGTAQWGMKQPFPELVDFEKQLPAFFKEPSRSIDSPPAGVTVSYVYGSGVWPLFLQLKYGPTTVREVFEEEAKGTANVYQAIDTVLKAKGASLAEAFPLFGAWNASTKSLAGTGGYPDAAKYPGITIGELADGVGEISSGLGYFAYRGTVSNNGISLETDAARNAGVLVPIIDGKPDLAKATKLPANGDGEVLVVVGGVTTKKTDAPFKVRIGDPVQGSSGGTSGTSGNASSSSGAAPGDDGGCTTTSSSSSSNGSVLLVVAGLVVARLMRRRGR